MIKRFMHRLEDKLEWIAQSQKEGAKVCMIGDGINDAPAPSSTTPAPCSSLFIRHCC